jgi:preprotein translocase subunit SecF
MHIVKHRSIYFAIIGLITIAALVSATVFGLKPSLEFTGGTLVEVRYEGERPTHEALSQNLEAAGFEGFSLRETGENSFTLRTHNLTTDQRDNLASYFAYQGGTGVIQQLTEVGPTLGKELRNKSIIALALVLLGILLFIAFAFRKVSQPVSSWTYGFVAVVTLIHDVIVPVGFFAALGHFTGAEVDTLFVTAILTVLGFSIHDTIVVFDRTRENIRLNHEHSRKEAFEVTAGRSLNQTFVRSINTSLTVIITLVVLYAFGPESTKAFALTLLVGILAGTFSSIALATPLLVAIEKRNARKGKN